MPLTTEARMGEWTLSQTEFAAWRTAAHKIASADSIFIGAGSELTTASGLLDYHGDDRFFYLPHPEYDPAHTNARAFLETPEKAWGWAGYMLSQSRMLQPHKGYDIVRSWGQRKDDMFVYTSNVEGHFQKAGYPSGYIVESQGSLHRLQCSVPCTKHTWSAGFFHVEVDPDTLQATSELPKCPRCGAPARPNINLGSDKRWIPGEKTLQEHRLISWLEANAGPNMLILELGAPIQQPNVRSRCSRYARAFDTNLIRIHPRDDASWSNGITLREELVTSMERLDRLLQALWDRPDVAYTAHFEHLVEDALQPVR